jgi:hypothetical protein
VRKPGSALYALMLCGKAMRHRAHGRWRMAALAAVPLTRSRQNWSARFGYAGNVGGEGVGPDEGRIARASPGGAGAVRAAVLSVIYRFL